MKNFIACHLFILAVGTISPKAVASPDLNGNPPKSNQTLQTFESIEIKSVSLGEREPRKKESYQWSEIFLSPAVSFTRFELMTGNEVFYLPYSLVPLNSRPNQQLEIVAETPITHTTSEGQPPDSNSDLSPTPENSPAPDQTANEAPTPSSPLRFFSGSQPNAWHLGKGEVIVNFYNRLFLLSGTDRGGTGAYPNVGFTWGITNNLEFTLEYQQVDSGSPGNQGDFRATRKTDSLNADGTLEFKQRIWENSSQTQALSGVVSVSWGDRGFNYTRQGSRVFESNSDPVPAIQLPFSALVDDKWEFTISPTIAFFPNQSALYWHVLPINNPGSFRTSFGFTGAIAYHLNSRLKFWGDLFVPVTGNNSIIRNSGFPAKTVGYNAGIRYLVNPRAGLEIFVSNTLGSKGPLALTADRSLTALGTGFFFMPDFIGANRRYPDSFKKKYEGATTPLIIYGLGLFDRETLNSGQFFFNFLGGGQGISTSLSYGLVKDAEIGIFLDYVFGTTDESLQGLSGKLRILNQAEGDPLTVSFATTVGQTNAPFVNFFFNDTNAFEQRDLNKNVPFIARQDDTETGQLFIVTVSLPLQYKFDQKSAVWVTPMWGYVQRMGTELTGLHAGGLLPLFSDISLMGEVGVNFIKPGNAFLGNSRARVIPWTVSLQWDTSRLLGLTQSNNGPKVHLYVTNSLGFSPWLHMRVQEQNTTSVGAGFSIPF